MVYPKLTVAPPLSVPYRYGLQSVVVARQDQVERALSAGVEYDPETCGRDSNYWRDPNCDPLLLAPFDAPQQVGTWDDPVGATPFTIYSQFSCAGVSIAEGRERLLAQFALREPIAVEEAFWNGDLLALGISPTLASSEYVAASTAPVTGVAAAVAHLERAYYAVATTQGVIHAPRWVYPYAAQAGLLVRDGNVLRTPADTQWAFGVGYSGDQGPADATDVATADQAWMYMTGPVSQWRSDVMVLPPDDAALNLTSNLVELIAQRTYLLAFDCQAVSVLAGFDQVAGGGGGGF